jgi:predicted Zn-dependent protease
LTVLGTLAPTLSRGHADLLLQIEELSKTIEKEPNNPELYVRRAELNRSHLAWDTAAADLDKARELDPAYDLVDFMRGRLLFDSGWPLSAKACLDQYLTRKPNDAGALIARAHVLTHLQLRLDAAKDFTRAIACSPEPGPELFIERAQALGAAGPEYLAEALSGLDDGVKRLGPLVTLQLFAIDLELKQGKFDGAISRLDQVAEKSPRKESWLARRGEILIEAGRPAEAKRTFESALAAMEKLPPARRNVPAMLELQRRIRSHLEKLGAPPAR